MTAQRQLAVALLAWLAVSPSVASAEQPALTQTIAVWRIDALGIDDEIVARLESLFRTELERMAGHPMPSRREMSRALGKSRLARCNGSTRCLAQIGGKVGVALIVSGNVAQLGDSYVVNLKVIDVATKQEIRRVASDPLTGTPDELIEAVRVAAYRLVAPDQLHGSIAILTDLIGAKVELDGKQVGKTPLTSDISGLELGPHTLRVTADDYSPFEEQVIVRFQKTTRVVVRLVKAEPVRIVPIVPGNGERDLPPPKRWYNSTWFYVGVGVTAALVGGYVGYQLSKDDVIDCSASPMACM